MKLLPKTLTPRTKNVLLMHFVVMIFGITGILGKLITIESVPLVFWRTTIGGFAIYIWLKSKGKITAKTPKTLLKLAGIGILIAIHWITFFASIKVSNVSVALTMIAISPMFVGLLEPWIFKRKLDLKEILVAAVVLGGVATILSFNTQYVEGMVLGIISAFFASLFATLNGVMINKHDAENISLVELISASIAVLIFMTFTGEVGLELFIMSFNDWILILILAVVATSFAFTAFTHVMTSLTPFTTAVAINLEPIYAMILALIIFGEDEVMGPQFYLGASLIIGAVALNGILKSPEET